MEGGKVEIVADFIFLGSKISVVGDCSHEMKRFLLLGRKVITNLESEVTQSCPTLCDPMDCSPPGSSICGIFQARVLEWVVISFSRGSSQPRDRTWVSHIVSRCFTIWAIREVTHYKYRQHIIKQRHHSADKGSHSQSYGFSSSHVLMWVFDHKEGCVPKNWCFWIVVLEKTLESPLDSKGIQLVHPKGNQPWTLIERIDAEADAPILWPPAGKSWLTGRDPDAGKD